jgi:hypothetical protein
MAFRGEPGTLLGAVMVNTSYAFVVCDEAAKRPVHPTLRGVPAILLDLACQPFLNKTFEESELIPHLMHSVIALFVSYSN